MLRGGEGFVPIPESLTGKKSWLYYAPLPATGWSLGVVFPDDELFADAGRLMQRTVAIAVLGLAILALVITVISRGITKPLRGLARKTADIAHGDFAATVPETGAKEIAHLARSFNRMGRAPGGVYRKAGLHPGHLRALRYPGSGKKASGR